MKLIANIYQGVDDHGSPQYYYNYCIRPSERIPLHELLPERYHLHYSNPRKARFRKAGKFKSSKPSFDDVLKTRDRTSVLRSIRQIKNIGLANQWDYFGTVTLNPKWHDRTDYPTAAKKLISLLRSYKRDGLPIKYLIIPELHGDKVNYHFHCLISGIDSLLTTHSKKSLQDQNYLEFKDLSEQFGYNSFSKVNNSKHCVLYILKYVNKEFGVRAKNDGMRLYYCSQGLNRPERVIEENFEPSDAFLTFSFPSHGSFYRNGVSQDVFEIVAGCRCVALLSDNMDYYFDFDADPYSGLVSKVALIDGDDINYHYLSERDLLSDPFQVKIFS